MDSPDPFFNFLQEEDANMGRALVKTLRLKDPQNYKMIFDEMTQIFVSHPENFPGFKWVHFHGSRVFGLANDESDLDVFVEFGECLFPPYLLWEISF